MGADIAWSWGAKNSFACRYLSVFFCLVENLRQVIANCLRQTSGVDCDNIWFVDCKNIIDCLYQVGLPAED